MPGLSKRPLVQLYGLRLCHLLTAIEDCLEQRIEAWTSQPNNALAEIVTEGCSSFSRSISGVRNDGGSGIPVRYEFSVEHYAERSKPWMPVPRAARPRRESPVDSKTRPWDTERPDYSKRAG
jgi:hypothetical protein